MGLPEPAAGSSKDAEGGGGGLQETSPEHPGSPTLSLQAHGPRQLSVTSQQRLAAPSLPIRCSEMFRAERGGWSGGRGRGRSGYSGKKGRAHKVSCSVINQEKRLKQIRLQGILLSPFSSHLLQRLRAARTFRAPLPASFLSFLSHSSKFLALGLWASAILSKHPTPKQKHPQTPSP